MQASVAEVIGSGINPAPQNRAVILEVDQARQRDFRRWLLVFGILIAAVSFDGWQRFGIRSTGFRIEEMQQLRDAEEARARELRLEAASLKELGRIERMATSNLRLVAPGIAETHVIERVVPPEQPPSSVVASR